MINYKCIVAAPLAGLLISCGNPSPSKEAESPHPVPVETVEVELSEVPEYFEVPGTVQSETSIVVSARVMGQVETLVVHEGERVRKGDRLATLDSRETSAHLQKARAAAVEARAAKEELERGIRAAEAAVSGAESNRDFAAATAKRYAVLRERQSVSPQEFDEVDSRYKGAASELERARETLASVKARRAQVLARIDQTHAEADGIAVAMGNHQVTAPIDGVVTARYVEPGMLAMPGTPLIAIEDNLHYELKIAVEESRIGTVRLGQTATVRLDVLKESAEALVKRIVPASDPGSRTYTVTLELKRPGAGSALRTGMFGRAVFAIGSKTALIVPESALVQRGQLTQAYTVRDNTAVLQLVKTGKRYDTGIEILSGLSPGETVVLAPGLDLSDGALITEKRPEERQ